MVVGTLAQTYKAPDGWDANAVYALGRVAMSNNVDVAVYSLDGQLLFTVQGSHARARHDERHTGGGGMMGEAAGTGSPAPAASGYGAGQFRMQTFPVVVRGEKVATAEIYSDLGMRQAAESAYQSALTRNLVIAGIAAAVVAFLISLFVSRRITAPLEELTDAAADVATGDFGVRVAPRGNDEVGALATAFNAMADRLARDEQWRRDMTADLSHELRTPLATIQSRIEALEDGVLPATPENLRVIGAEVERLGRLLGALRNLNELESEDLDVEHEPLDLAAGRRRRHGARADGVRGEGRRPGEPAGAGHREGRPRPPAAGGRQPPGQRPQVHARGRPGRRGGRRGRSAHAGRGRRHELPRLLRERKAAGRCSR